MTDHNCEDARWEYQWVQNPSAVAADKMRLDGLLAEGWEPFAATPRYGQATFTVHLRRRHPGRNEPS